MPKTNCCVPYCHANSKQHTHLSCHVLPLDETLRRRLIVLIWNNNLRVTSNGTAICVIMWASFSSSRRSKNLLRKDPNNILLGTWVDGSRFFYLVLRTNNAAKNILLFPVLLDHHFRFKILTDQHYTWRNRQTFSSRVAARHRVWNVSRREAE